MCVDRTIARRCIEEIDDSSDMNNSCENQFSSDFHAGTISHNINNNNIKGNVGNNLFDKYKIVLNSQN